jgi:hypothetical protein
LAYASTKSAAALLPRENDFIASSCRIDNASILISLARSFSTMSSSFRGRGTSTSNTALTCVGMLDMISNRSARKIASSISVVTKKLVRRFSSYSAA